MRSNITTQLFQNNLDKKQSWKSGNPENPGSDNRKHKHALHRRKRKTHTGNAMLVANSIYSACRFYDLFQETELKGKCAIVTSYRPADNTALDNTNRQQQYNTYRKMLAAYFNEPEDKAMHKVEEFEKAVKKDFVEKPAEMNFSSSWTNCSQVLMHHPPPIST